MAEKPNAKASLDTWQYELFFFKCLSESLLREDDVFYETSKTSVKKAFGLSDPENDYCKGNTLSVNSSYQSPLAKVYKVLGNLEIFPPQVLLSMHRKLEGESGKLIRLETHRSGWNRDRLIDRVKSICESRLLEIQEGDELPHSVAKAMAVTTLFMNLTPAIQNQNLEDFYQFSPDIVTLQNNITKAIWLINEKVRISELRKFFTV